DDSLSGTPGSTVSLATRPPVVIPPTPGETTAVPRDDPSTAGPAAPRETGPRPVVFKAEPTRGTDLQVTLDLAMQRKAERILASQKSPTAMAVLDPDTGAALVLAVSDSAEGRPLATTGRYAPGSTFKVVTSLALLRQGLTPESMVNCPQRTVVDGRVIENYDDFPRSRVGRMRLLDALALSCNTAFVNERDKLSGPRIRGAAVSLGMGQDHDAGFPSFFGSVPDPANVVGLAEASFGQGTVQASPMSMAAVAASVSAGRTRVPYLISDNRPEQDGKPLTAGEAKDLQAMMGAVVKSGSGRSLGKLVTGAKTGTAEYGTKKPPKTHAWMMAYTSDLAIAVLVTDGRSGSGSAGPLIKQFLS
ncbi:MAG TPA: penicillin-binding transpeptidase domain-containing protein, partial [Bacillota bacterium]|nr:penicillin-binding transpeptidase domain-containing protein [Bacillota bacterium]